MMWADKMCQIKIWKPSHFQLYRRRQRPFMGERRLVNGATTAAGAIEKQDKFFFHFLKANISSYI